RLAEGVSELEAALAWYGRSQLRFTRSQFSLWLADAYLRQGASARARKVAEEILATSQEVGYGHLEGVAHRMVGECLLTADPVTAESHLGVAVVILDRVGAQHVVPNATVAHSECHTSR